MRILLVEDEKPVAAFVKKAMIEEKHAIDVAYTGLQGEELAISEAYDLIMLDIMLPEKDGLAVLRTLRDSEVQTPVLMLTARGEVSDRVAGLDAGADDYLPKPFAVAELRARVRSLLRRQSDNKTSVLSVGGLRLDTISHEVTLSGRAIELTNREYAILEYLLRHKNRLLSKGMIAEHVWDFHFSGDHNIIEVYISRLRNKIHECSAQNQRLIHTVRNGGYILREP